MLGEVQGLEETGKGVLGGGEFQEGEGGQGNAKDLVVGDETDQEGDYQLSKKKWSCMPTVEESEVSARNKVKIIQKKYVFNDIEALKKKPKGKAESKRKDMLGKETKDRSKCCCSFASIHI